MIEKFTEEDKKEILEKLTIPDCEKEIDLLRSDIDRVRVEDPEDFFNIEKKRRAEIKYYKRAIKFLQETEKTFNDINIDISNTDLQLVCKIIVKICILVRLETSDIKESQFRKFARNLYLDIILCHCNGCKLDLEKLLNSDENSLHKDITGIFDNIDRKTGKLNNGFVPRCAK